MALVTQAEIGALDPYFSNVTLLLSGNGSNASTAFTDNSLSPKTITAVGNAQISTAQSKWGGSSLYLDGTAGAYLTAGTSFALNTGDFTIEAWVKLDSIPAMENAVCIASRRVGVTGFFFLITMTATSFSARWNAWYDGSSWSPCDGPTIAISTDWVHVAVCKNAGIYTVFVNGQPGASTNQGNPAPTDTALFIGKDSGDVVAAHPIYIDDLRITQGVARYTGAFTAPIAEFAWLAGAGLRGFASLCSRASYAPPQALDGLGVRNKAITPTIGKRDIYFGGVGQVAGTVKNTPATPVRRRVLLIEEATRAVIRETWSDAATGAYSFGCVAMNTTYTVLSYDHTQAFRAVVADRIVPEFMPEVMLETVP